MHKQCGKAVSQHKKYYIYSAFVAEASNALKTLNTYYFSQKSLNIFYPLIYND